MTNKIEVFAKEGTTEIVVREGKANDVHIPNGIQYKDLSIDAVKEYLSKLTDSEKLEVEDSFITYSTEKRYIELAFSVRRENPDLIRGVIVLHPDLEKFEINQGKRQTPHQLADFIRMNRHYFETKDQAIKLESTLRNFTAEVDKKLEASDDKRANIKASIVQTVKTSIPESFVIKIPVFVGSDAISVNVEVDINSTDLSCSLMSPDLKSLIETESVAIIKNQLKEIEEAHPKLRIFQK